jgi:Ser/Thr protein kinase RdoA (MazF antagonist)
MNSRDIARAALRHYDLAPRRLTRAAESFNTVFRVSTASGSYALRVGAALQVHAEGTLQAEGAWLDRLRASGLAVPAVLANSAGQLGTDVATGDGSRVCALFDWVVGRSLLTRLTRPTAAALGRLAARLHADARAWELTEPLDVLVADRVLYWRLPPRLTEPDVVGASVFADALAHAQTVLDDLWRSGRHLPHVLHGDLTPANTIVTPGGELVPIDFQDMVWGFDVQDLAISIAALSRAPAGARLIDAFRGGYQTERGWPDVAPALVESLIAARALNQINLTVHLHDPAGIADYLAAHAERLRNWMQSPLPA